MRARAQVHKVVALPVEGDDLVLGQVANQLHLIGLAALLHVGDGLITGQGKPHLAVVLFDDAGHFLLDFLHHLGGEGLGHVKVVVKAVLNCRADGQLGIGHHIFDGGGQHVGGRVAQHAPRLRVIKGEELQAAIPVQGVGQLHQLAVEARRYGRLFEITFLIAQDVQRVGSFIVLMLCSLYQNLHVILLLMGLSSDIKKHPSPEGRMRCIRGSTLIAGLPATWCRCIARRASRSGGGACALRAWLRFQPRRMPLCWRWSGACPPSFRGMGLV